MNLMDTSYSPKIIELIIALYGLSTEPGIQREIYVKVPGTVPGPVPGT